MKVLANSDLLALWERGQGLHPLDRALLVLGAALPGTSYASLANWSLGRRNEELVRVRCACFGVRLEGWTACESCGEKLELDVDGRTLAQGQPNPKEAWSKPLLVHGRAFRPPTSRDLAAGAGAQDPQQGAILVAESCLLDSGEPLDWSEEELEEVGESMARADPMAEILLAMLCPVCGNEASATLDISTYFWTEIEARVKRLRIEVHDLASAYGWSEGNILSLNEQRRAVYLEMVRG